MASSYVFTFYKRVADSTGHEVEAPQGAVETSSGNLRDAIETAIQTFAAQHSTADWSLHADRICISVA